jgi:predicted transcriptional regulator
MVGMKYRNNQQIVESILSATKEVGMEGIPVTRLMQTSNLSYTRLGKFMSKLTGSGLINKIAATSAEVTDASGLTHVCPNGGAVFGDKGYCVNPAKATLKRNGCHDATIKKANMKGKDTEKDRWISKMRSPYERVFAHRNRRVRYRGLEKVQFQVGIRALTFNLKRMITLGFNNIDLVPA